MLIVQSSCTNAFRRTLLAFAEIRLPSKEVQGQSSPSTTSHCSLVVDKFQIQDEAGKTDSKEIQKQKRLERQKELKNKWTEEHKEYFKMNVNTNEKNSDSQ